MGTRRGLTEGALNMQSIRTSARARCVRVLPAMLMASTMLTGASAAFAETSAQSTTVGELIVTAQKREENVQKVPLSIQVLGAQKLDQLQVKNVNDYVKYLPSVAIQTIGPGYTDVYMRGVASGENNNHSGPQPTTATYLDEAPITTIGGALDIHVYDIARVEALAGPQGTLYGSSSEAGTIRLITNKPQLGVFSASYDAGVNTVDHGGIGYGFDGMVNMPISDKTAIRLVGWEEHDAGYIDNVPGTRTYPVSGITINNTATAKNDYNDVDLYGGRAALKIDLNDNWTVTPSIVFQDEISHGVFGYDPRVGDLKVTHFYPERTHDRWFQAALAIEGHVSNFDIVYAGSFMKRDIHSVSDYTDYSYWYDQAPFGYGIYNYDNGGNLINPSQTVQGLDHFTKQSHELRVSSPTENRFRFVGGLFYERQTHGIQQRYVINDLADALSVPGWPDTIWLTEQLRVDRDYAAFGEASFDITPKLTLTGGLRVFKYDNSLVGFFGFGAGFSSHTGEAACFEPAIVAGSPCTDLDKSVTQTGVTHKLNLTYRLDDNKLVYATWSRGFRPGGINRRSDFPPYVADFLTNYELGWKTTWLDGKLRFNGALYLEEWNNFQFSFLGSNGLTNIRNAPQAEIKGVEADLTLRPDEHWSFSGAAAFTDAKLTKVFCEDVDPVTGLPITNCNPVNAPSGSQLPVTPRFKANGTVRYEFDVGSLKAHLQGSVVGQSSSWADLRTLERNLMGPQRSYATLDLTTGIARDNWSLELSLLNATDTRADVYKYAECAIAAGSISTGKTAVCGNQPYTVTNRPRTFAVKFAQKF